MATRVIKSLCMFCMKENCRKQLCRAKGEVMRAYAKKFPRRDFWKVMHGIESGQIDLDGEATRLIASRKKGA